MALYEFDQDCYNGYHTVERGVRFKGWLLHGLPHGLCSIKWPDGSEYHGECRHGQLCGYGRYIFASEGGGAEFRGILDRALPVAGFYHPPGAEARRLIDVSSLPCAPIWALTHAMLAQSHSFDAPLPPYRWGKADCLAVARQVSRHPSGHPEQSGDDCAYMYRTDHISKVTARLVWARPVFGDEPLWNAHEARGKIVAGDARDERSGSRRCR